MRILIGWRKFLVLVLILSAASTSGSVSALSINAQSSQEQGQTLILPPLGFMRFSGSLSSFDPKVNTYDFDRNKGDILLAKLVDNQVVVNAMTPDGRTRTITLAPPPKEQVLPGIYPHTHPSNFGTANLRISDESACLSVSGETDVLAVSIGPHERIHELHFKFDVVCLGSGFPVKGEIWVKNPPSPADLDAVVTVHPSGTVDSIDGAAKVSGSLTCNKPAQIKLWAYLSSTVSTTPVSDSSSTQVDCTGRDAVKWQMEFVPFKRAYQAGPARLELQISGFDTDYYQEFAKKASLNISLIAHGAPGN